MAEDLTRRLAGSGVGFPRGLLGPEAQAYARAIVAEAPEDELERRREAVARAHWVELRLPVAAALRRAVAADPSLGEALALADDADPANPLALALAERAGQDLATALRRSQERLDELEGRLGEADERASQAAAARVAGVIVADLLDLDPEDFEPEIAAYVEAEESEAAMAALSRATGDRELRSWAREALEDVDAPEAPRASAYLHRLAEQPPPEDPAEDVIWISTALALSDEAVELALVTASEEPDAPT